jgi:large subunit ribosomal protein L4e
MKVKVQNLVTTIVESSDDTGLVHLAMETVAKDGKNMTLPDSFSTEMRHDLVRRAVHSSRANRRQPYGHREHDGKRKPQPGMKHSVEWWGKGRGVSRIMRKTGQRTGAQNPHTRGGRRAHGPYVVKDWTQKLNTGERRLARNVAIASTADSDLVADRGHRFDDGIKFPIILGSYAEARDGKDESVDVEQMTLEQGSRKFLSMMDCLGLSPDLDRARNGRKIRAGKGTMRGRPYRTPRSILLVVAEKSGLAKAARNIPGVDVAMVSDLSTEDLAPGGEPGRLTVWTKSAIEAME